jgi:hypothetical protein
MQSRQKGRSGNGSVSLDRSTQRRILMPCSRARNHTPALHGDLLRRLKNKALEKHTDDANAEQLILGEIFLTALDFPPHEYPAYDISLGK